MGWLAFALSIPVLGLLATLLTPLLAPALGPHVWPGVSRLRAFGAGVLASSIFWLGTALMSQPAFPSAAGNWFAYMALPLCAPATHAMTILPPIAALVVYGCGCTVSVVRGRPWIWVAGTWAAEVAAIVVLSLVSSGGWIC
jgi:hypothetical protein